MHVVDRADRIGLDQFNDPPIVRSRVDLRAHLRDALVPGGGAGNQSGLGHRVRQRLFAVHVLARLQPGHGRQGVHVVRRGHHDGVDAFLIQEVAIVCVNGGTRKALPGLAQHPFVHVAQGHDLGPGGSDVAPIIGALVGRADHAHVEPFIGRRLFLRRSHSTGPKGSRPDPDALQEASARAMRAHEKLHVRAIRGVL